MKPEVGAAGRLPPDRAAEEERRADILPPALELGNCVACRGRLQLVGGATSCPTCSAWRRWASAHRIACRVPERDR